MGKKNKQQSAPTKKVVEFKDLKTKDGWHINLNKKSGRKDLIKDDKVIFSDVNSEACKNVAFQRFEVSLTSWS